MVERQLFLLSSSAQADDPVIPILAIASASGYWMPAFAGMTNFLRTVWPVEAAI
jgi:hypothetical protein